MVQDAKAEQMQRVPHRVHFDRAVDEVIGGLPATGFDATKT
jgi:hypothetical protein